MAFISSTEVENIIYLMSGEATLRVQTHIVIRKKLIVSYNDLEKQIHIFSLLFSA